jgi:uncharacterized membrane protein
MRTKKISTAAVLATLYTVLVLSFSPISFLTIQIRVANVLMGLVPLLGMPAVIGLSLGVLVANVFSPLGPIDLVSSVFSFISLYIVWKLKELSVLLGLTLYSIIMGLWVSFMISLIFGAPYLITLLYVTVGIFISTAIFGYLLYKGIQKLYFRR